jgi:hypothetical protein
MKTGVRLLGTCHRLLRAVLMIKWSDDKSGMVIGAARLRLVGRQCKQDCLCPCNARLFCCISSP